MLITTLAIFLASAPNPTINAIKRPHHSATRGTHVDIVAYRGWSKAYRISNGVADVVIVPSIGRIMSYSLTGHPETDPIWNNPDELAKSPSTKDWVNFGGDKVWPNPQNDWEKHGKLKGNWPPDTAFDSGPSKVTLIPMGVRLTNPLSSNFNLQLTRDIVLRPGQSNVTITDTFRRPKSDPTHEARIPLGLWNVTQTRSDGTIYLPLGRKKPGYISLMDSGPNVRSNWIPVNGVLTVTAPSDTNTKVGTVNEKGWMASLYAGNIVFAEHFTYEPDGKYLDRGANAEVYTNPKPGYIEVETLGPCSIIAPGHSLIRTIIWTLQRLPKTPKSATEAVKLISRSAARR